MVELCLQRQLNAKHLTEIMFPKSFKIEALVNMSGIRFSGTDLGFGQVSYFLIRSPIVLRVYNPFVTHMSHQRFLALKY